MNCPKCNTKVKENETFCPKCHKVLLLECPNCHSLGESSVCEKCGYTILIKCSKCGKNVPVTKDFCKCGFSTKTSLAYQECESDEFASLIIKFGSLNAIKKSLKSQELYAKFFFKLKNLLLSQIKGLDCKFITYNDIFVVNFNKELSFSTSSNKAVRFALKVVNAFSALNLNVLNELGVSLNLTLALVKKSAEMLQDLTTYESNVKPLSMKKVEQKYLKGMQVILDQYIYDEINKNYKTDSLYSLENNGKTIMFYEIILDSYVLPPSSELEEPSVSIANNTVKKESNKEEKDIYSFRVFDINAKCSFEKLASTDLLSRLGSLDLDNKGKLISIKSLPEYSILTSDLVNFYRKNEFRVLTVTCTEELSYKPWGVFETLFRDYFNLAYHNKFVDLVGISEKDLKVYKPLFDLIFTKPVKAMSPEDARFAYMEYWGKFLKSLEKTVVIIDGFENIDDTSLQTLELYFDKFKSIKPNFVFLTTKEVSAHSKIKGLLRTSLYTEFSLMKSSIDSCLSTLKVDATDFIQSFYFEKIKENFDGSFLYFLNALEYLKDTGVLIEFENKLLIKNNKSVILPQSLKELYKARMKYLSKNPDISFILVYTSFLGFRLDFQTLSALSVKDVEKNAKFLEEKNLAYVENNVLRLNNSQLLSSVISVSLKKEAETFLVKNIIAQLGKGLDDYMMAILMGKLGVYKEEYLILWRNSQFAIKTGDYDAYLKNCLGFLSLVEYIESNISAEEIENNKKDVFNNILMCLYGYSPAKIYFIEKVLLVDAINQKDDDKIVKLSNLMLQGALISSNYTEALGLLHNIFSRMPEPVLKSKDNVNTKFLLLSLVHIEILYNIGEFRQCVEIGEEILSVLSSEVLEKVKPASFSTNLFVSHILETLRLVGFAKLFLLDENLDDFFAQVSSAMNLELPEKDCILAIRDFLQGKTYDCGNVEEYNAFSKLIFLLLQEFSVLKDDYKLFAQNIYQAKLLALDIHQAELEMFCDLLIAYAYSKIGINEKAESIYLDLLEKSETSAMFNMILLTKFFLAKLRLSQSEIEQALLLINDSLALIRKQNNQSKILYALFEKFYIDTVISQEITSVDVDSEEQKLIDLKEKLAVFLG